MVSLLRTKQKKRQTAAASAGLCTRVRLLVLAVLLALASYPLFIFYFARDVDQQTYLLSLGQQQQKMSPPVKTQQQKSPTAPPQRNEERNNPQPAPTPLQKLEAATAVVTEETNTRDAIAAVAKGTGEVAGADPVTTTQTAADVVAEESTTKNPDAAIDDTAAAASDAAAAADIDPVVVVAVPPLQQQQQQQPEAHDEHRVAGLSCEAHGGPSADAAQEMVYWRDIPKDAEYQCPLRRVRRVRQQQPSATTTTEEEEELFLTFEPDEGGWNNIRMSMETAVALAVATGRTLVLPPKMHFYLLWDGGGPDRNVVGFGDFFHFGSVAAEHAAASGLKVIPFQEFLERQALTGQLLDRVTGAPSFPPGNRTDWTGAVINYQATKGGEGKTLWEWMRSVTKPLECAYDNCVVAIPAAPGKEAADRMPPYLQQVFEQDELKYADEAKQKGVAKWRLRRDSFTGHPTLVNASATDRLAELLANRNTLFVYDETMQSTKVLHASGETNTGFRLLIHFYAFLFFEDWKQELWVKRFIRDHFRYLDEIQCGAARVVEQVRKRAREHGDKEGRYDAFHIRRGDFQYDVMYLSAQEIYDNNTRTVVQDARTVFVATDERNKTFFDPLREHYNLLFLDDFKDQIEGINPNYYGMLDQLVASRGDVFVGAFYSTFTGYINRMRGHHAQKRKLGGHQDGLIESYYYVPESHEEFRRVMRSYHSVQQAFWQQEFPVCWRDIDHDVNEDGTEVVSSR